MHRNWIYTATKVLLAIGLAMSPFSMAFAEAEVEASPRAEADSTWCLLSDGLSCEVATQSVGFTIKENPNGSVLVFYVVQDQKFVEQGSLIVENDLDQQLQFGRISDQEAQQIHRELVSRVDVSYHLPPTSQGLLKEVGFSLETQLSPEDDIDMLRVHLQLVLGVGPVTASYLVRAMGVAVVAGAQDLPKAGAPNDSNPADSPEKSIAPSAVQPPIDPETLPNEVPDQPAEKDELLPIPKVVPSERLFVLPDELHILYCTQS